MWTHFLILSLFLAFMGGIGLYFARRQTSTDTYFVAGRSLPGWVAGLSLFATAVSSVSFISYPGAGYEGKWWASMVPVLSAPLLLIPVLFVLIPMYRDLVKISVYEYVERRFDRGTRIYSTIAFFLSNIAKLAFVFYLVGLTVNTMTGWDLRAVIIVIGAVTVFYTLVGGIEAVIWTDVIQGIILWVGGTAALAFILLGSSHSPAELWRFAWENERFDFGTLEPALARPTFLMLLAVGFLDGFQKYAGDQTMVQRFLVAKSDREAAKGAVIAIVLTLLCAATFTFTGTCLWSFYHIAGGTIPGAAMGKAENVFPHFLHTQVPAVWMAVVLAALLSAAMSTVSSALNGFGAVGVEDYYRLLRPAASDRERLAMGKLLVAVSGALCVSLSLLLVRSHGTAIELWYLVLSIVSSGIVGMFFLALVSTRTNWQGIYVGITAATGFTVWAVMTMNTDTASDLRNTFDLGVLETPIHGYMIGIISSLLFVVVGFGASFLFPDNTAEKKALTFWEWRRSHEF